jgi:hypothetical protein
VSDVQTNANVAGPGNTESSTPVSVAPAVGDLVKAAVADNKAAEAKAVAEAPKPAIKDIMMKGVEIKLLEDAAIITMPNGTTKTTSLQDFYNMISFAFSKAVEDNGAEIMLPKNCIYLRTTSKSIYVTLFYPEGIYDLHYQYGGRDRKYKIPTPNVVVCLILDITTNPKGEAEARVTNAKYFCTDYPQGAFKIKHSTGVDHGNGLYLLPFSNVYEDGKLCTGENAMPTVMPRGDLRRLNWHFDVLWNSPFNNDLGLHAIGSWDAGVESWYVHLQERQQQGLKFPYDKLRGYRPAAI